MTAHETAEENRKSPLVFFVSNGWLEENIKKQTTQETNDETAQHEQI